MFRWCFGVGRGVGKPKRMVLVNRNDHRNATKTHQNALKCREMNHKSNGKFKVYPVIVIFLQVYPSLLSVAKPFYKKLFSLLLFFLFFSDLSPASFTNFIVSGDVI